MRVGSRAHDYFVNDKNEIWRLSCRLAGRTYPLPARSLQFKTRLSSSSTIHTHSAGQASGLGTGPQLRSGGRHIHRFQVFANRDPLSCITLTRLFAEAVVMAGVSKSEQTEHRETTKLKY
jgi:hypothetical protein